jgi:hypothetical protein
LISVFLGSITTLLLPVSAVNAFRFRCPLTLSILTERRALAPYGKHGGHPGARGVNLLHRRDGRVVSLGAKCSIAVDSGEVFELLTPGESLGFVRCEQLCVSRSEQRCLPQAQSPCQSAPLAGLRSRNGGVSPSLQAVAAGARAIVHRGPASSPPHAGRAACSYTPRCSTPFRACKWVAGLRVGTMVCGDCLVRGQGVGIPCENKSLNSTITFSLCVLLTKAWSGHSLVYVSSSMSNR